MIKNHCSAYLACASSYEFHNIAFCLKRKGRSRERPSIVRRSANQRAGR